VTSGRKKAAGLLPQWVIDKNPEALREIGREHYRADWPADRPGIALLIGRQEDVEEKISAAFRIGGRPASQAEYLSAIGGRLIGHVALDLLRLYVSAGRWEELPPHKPYTGPGATGRDWRLYSSILNAFVARDKKEIAAAIRKADKEGWTYLPYAIVLEARKLGLDPKIKKYDF
jgi:hypothetical protein